MNKYLRNIGIICLFIFSFYYTSKSIDIVRSVDPIMREIEVSKDKYSVDSINATIKDNTIIPGVSGKSINKNISYNKMKKYGAYNDSLMVFEEVSPTVSIKNNYDKYVISGNSKLKQVSLLFYIEDLSTLKIITNYLGSEQLKGTLIIKDILLDYLDSELVENYEVELLFDEISDVKVASSSNYLESITSKKNKYCISEKEDEELLNICKKHKMYTVIPSINLNSNVISTIKKNISNGSIVYIHVNNEVLKNLDYIVTYIRNKGYSFVDLNSLLKE